MWRFDRQTWELVPDAQGKIRPWMVLLAAPLLGACFVVYLPTLGLYLAGRALGEKAADVAQHRLKRMFMSEKVQHVKH